MTDNKALDAIFESWTSDLKKFANVPTEFMQSALISDAAYKNGGQIYVIFDILVDKKTGEMTFADEWEIDTRVGRKRR